MSTDTSYKTPVEAKVQEAGSAQDTMLPFYIKAVALLAVFANTLTIARGTCVADLSKVLAITVMEGSNGTWRRQLTDADDIEITAQDSNLFRTEGGSLVLNRSLVLDGKLNEAVCSLAFEKGPLKLTIKCKGVQDDSKLVFLPVNFTDDYFPRFKQPSYEAHISEHNSVNQSVMLFDSQAVDDDCGTSDIIYRLKEPLNGFDIIHGKVVATSVLDYERQKMYSLVVEALSKVPGGSKPYLSNSTTLSIYVDDIDDENPHFESLHHSINVTEETKLTTVWLTPEPPFRAVDGDTGVNDTIEYSYDNATDPSIDIQVNSSSGEIRIRSVLDREKQAEYIVTIKASQKNDPLRSATATLTIHVVDVNDHLPTFTSRPEEPISVQEGTPDGTFITVLQATDKDEGANANFIYKLEDKSGAFGIKVESSAGTHWLFVKNSSALEGNGTVKVKVILVPKVKSLIDGRSCDTNQTCSMELTIHVVDINDHSPVFTRASYLFNVRMQDLVLGNVSANDRDFGKNGNVTYSIRQSPTSCQEVAIDHVTGVLSVTSPYPRSHGCSLLIQACDNPPAAKDRRCSTVPVTIRVTGEIQPTYNVSVKENIPKGSVILPLPDMDLMVKDGNFSIEDSDLVTRQMLDRETTPVYVIDIYSSDLSSTIVSVVTVQVLDVNDNAPIFSQDVYSREFTQDLEAGDLFVQVLATDADEGRNADVTYSLLNGREWFSIDIKTGDIKLIARPPLNDVEKISLVLFVTNEGTPPLTNTAVVEVVNPIFNKTASLILPLTVAEVKKETKNIERFLSNTLKYKVTIENYEALSTKVFQRSTIVISAKRKNGMNIPRETLNSMLKTSAAAIQAEYGGQAAIDDDGDTDKFKVPFIAVLCVAGLLLLILLVVLCILSRRLKRQKQNASILKNLNASTSIYDNTGQRNQHSSGGSTPYLNMNGKRVDESENGSNPTAIVNQAYDPDYDEVCRETQTANVSTSDQLENGLVGNSSESFPTNAADAVSSSTAVADIHDNEANDIYNVPAGNNEDDHQTDFVQSPRLTNLYPNLMSLEKEGGKNSDADSGVPSDKDTAEEEEEDEDSSISLNMVTLPSVGIVDVGTKARMDSDKPGRKDVTVGLTNVDGDVESNALNREILENPDEPEPDYNKKVRFEEAKGSEQTMPADDEANSKFFLETEVTAF